MNSYITRSLEPVLLRAAAEFPAVVLTGPRQSGKTTLLRHLFSRDYKYVSLEPPDVRAAAASDPRGFLSLYSSPVILDEVQYAPDLLPYIKEQIDSNRSKAGQFLLTGLQNLLISQRISESLAGRAAILRLLPLSNREIKGKPDLPLPWERESVSVFEKSVSYIGLWKDFLRGNYPELVATPDRDITLWHASYVQTYLERDVRNLRQVGDLSTFQSFLRILAARSGQLLNMADISRDLGVALNTIKNWVSVLEATYQIMILRPYYANIGKRLVKTPKIYFTDTGTLCYLAGLKDPEHAASGPLAGPIFETAVLSEIMKTIIHRGRDPLTWFWRTSHGTEVDVLVQSGSRLVPIEAKASGTPRPAMADAIRSFQEDMGPSAGNGYVVHLGDITLPLGKGVLAIPYTDL